MRSMVLIVASIGALLACRSTPEIKQAQGETICSLAPAMCERLCAGCDDMNACYRAGGECALRAGTEIYFRDFADKDADVFAPGCHYSFSDAACTLNGSFVNGDVCLNETSIMEYTLTLPCHDGCAERRECDEECGKLKLGSGKCIEVPHFCGPNQNSARCLCDKKPPPPEPEPEPLPTNPT